MKWQHVSIELGYAVIFDRRVLFMGLVLTSCKY